MKVIIRGKILDVNSKDWEFNGKKGTSYVTKVFDTEDKDIRYIKVDSSQALSLKRFVDTENIVIFYCSVFSEKLSVKVKEFYKEENEQYD